MKNNLRAALLRAGVKEEVRRTEIKGTERRQNKALLSLGEQFYLTKRVHDQRSMVMPIYKEVKK
jgi:hypothetical protein